MRKKDAYFTVEAAMVFPFVMGAVLFTIFMFIFQYDRCLMEQDIGMLVLYASNLSMEDGEKTMALMKARASEIYWDKYLAWEQEELQITIKRNEVIVEGAGTLIFPIPAWNFFNGKNAWRTESVQKAIHLNPVNFIRLYRRIEGGDKYNADRVCEEP